MKLKNNSDNKKIIDWKAYKSELDAKKTCNFNEYERDLHNMTMKDGLFENCLQCHEYKNILREMTNFDQTNFDYFNYEKELKLGELND